MTSLNLSSRVCNVGARSWHDPVTHPVFAYTTPEVQIQSDEENSHLPQLAL